MFSHFNIWQTYLLLHILREEGFYCAYNTSSIIPLVNANISDNLTLT